MKENKKTGSKKIKKIILILLTILVLAVLAVGGYYIFVQKGNVRNKLITAENYEEITNEVTKALGDSDDAYYYIYACINYMSEVGLTEEYINNLDESVLYKNIYNKTVQQLIDEGKTLMQQNGSTLEKFKQQVDAINNLSDEEILYYQNMIDEEVVTNTINNEI